MPDRFPPHPFWDFSLAVYARPGVAPACLVLQDRHDVDVNALLFCLWLAESGRGPVPRARLEAALAGAGDWHEDVVRALRAVRKRLKSPVGAADPALAQALRAQVQQVEIEAEHVEQLALAASAAAQAAPQAGLSAEARAAQAAAHIAIYFAGLGALRGAADGAALATIFAAIFGLPDPVLRRHVAAALGPAPAA